MDLVRTVRLLQVVVFGGLGIVGGAWAYRLVRYRGWLGAQFGVAVRSLVGHVSPAAYRLLRAHVDVHTLDPRDPTRGPHVGLRVVVRVLQSAPAFVPLMRTEARELADLLVKSAQESEREAPAGGDAPGLVRVLRKQGWLSPRYGAAVRDCVGFVSASATRPVRLSVEVHTLDPSNASAGPHVGVRVVGALLASSWTLAIAALSRAEEQGLADLLVKSARESESGLQRL